MDERLMDEIFEMLEEGYAEGVELADGNKDPKHFKAAFESGMELSFCKIRKLLLNHAIEEYFKFTRED